MFEDQQPDLQDHQRVRFSLADLIKLLNGMDVDLRAVALCYMAYDAERDEEIELDATSATVSFDTEGRGKIVLNGSVY